MQFSELNIFAIFTCRSFKKWTAQSHFLRIKIFYGSSVENLILSSYAEGTFFSEFIQ